MQTMIIFKLTVTPIDGTAIKPEEYYFKTAKAANDKALELSRDRWITYEIFPVQLCLA